MDHVEVWFRNLGKEDGEILIALLADQGYEGFEEIDNGMKAYVPASSFDKTQLDRITGSFGSDYSVSHLPDTNWNEVWESNFHPVVVGSFCAVRAEFHPPIKNVAHEIVITPKMSFGTGHHPTTHMIIKSMGEMNFRDKSVFDFGTGTGVLAILARKLGASKVLAVDNDDWSISNARENITRNGVPEIELVKTDHADVGEQFDIILANITRNVILDNFSFLTGGLKALGYLLLSGLLKDDEEMIMKNAKAHGLNAGKRMQMGGWVALQFTN